MTEPKQRRDLILHRPERALADEFGICAHERRDRALDGSVGLPRLSIHTHA
jgi:hypothetical protein